MVILLLRANRIKRILADRLSSTLIRALFWIVMHLALLIQENDAGSRRPLPGPNS